MRHVLIGLLWSLFASSANALVIGVYELSPHMVLEGTREPTGAVIDFAKEVLGKSDEFGPLEWRASNFARTLHELEAGRLDMVFLVAKNEKRSQVFRYSKAALFETRSAILTLKGMPPGELTSLDQLKGMRIGHANGSIIPPYFHSLNIEFENLTGDDYFQRGLKMVQHKRHDAYFAPTLTNAQYLLKRVHAGDQFAVLALPVDALGLYVVYSKALDEKLAARIDAQLMSNLGRYKALLSPYIR